MKERDRMQILLEEIRDKVQVIAEGHNALQAQINRLENKFDYKLDQMQVTLYALNDKLDTHMKQPSHL